MMTNTIRTWSSFPPSIALQGYTTSTKVIYGVSLSKSIVQNQYQNQHLNPRDMPCIYRFLGVVLASIFEV